MGATGGRSSARRKAAADGGESPYVKLKHQTEMEEIISGRRAGAGGGARPAAAARAAGPEAEGTAGESPFPKFAKPFPEECWAARDFLASVYGEPQRERAAEDARKRRAGIKRDPPAGGPAGAPGGAGAPPGCWTEGYARRSVLDSVIGTILSQNTTDLTSARAMKKLKENMPDWETVRTADPAAVMELIKEGGLAQTKTERIQAMLNTIREERGECSLEHLWELSTERVKMELGRFKGIGPKTVSCVLMFCLQRPEFPVDTHVWKIAKSLKWVPASASREETVRRARAAPEPGPPPGFLPPPARAR